MDRQQPSTPASMTDPRSPEAADASQSAVQQTTPLPAHDPAQERLTSFPYQPGDAILPGYRLVKRLGSGGFGEVWKATAPGGMTVAIKVLANLDRREGGREYRALQTIKNIHHAHIVPLFGVWLKSGDGRVLGEAELAAAEQRILAVRTDEERDARGMAATTDLPTAAADLSALELVVAMGLGDQTLFDRLREARQAGQEGLPPGQLLQWMQEAARALDHFNSGSRRSPDNAVAVQHCDIKPQNILLVGDVVQVCDFGLARAQGEVRATSNNMASLAYAAPEMVSKPYDPSPTTDQYSLAVTYVELRTGRLPYAEVTPAAILRSKLDGTLDLSGLSPSEASVLKRALRVDPKQRFQSCAEMIRAVQAAARPLTESSRVHGTDAPVVPEIRRGRGRGVLIAGGAVALAVLAGLIGMARHLVPTESRDAAFKRARATEKAGDFGAAGAIYEQALSDDRNALVRELWNLQSLAAGQKRFADTVSLLDRLEGLYRRVPAPDVQGIDRWDVVNTLAWYLATVPAAGDGSRARALAEEALGLAATDAAKRANSLDTLAVACAREGDWDRALATIEEAIAVAAPGDARDSFVTHRDRFLLHQPWDEP